MMRAALLILFTAIAFASPAAAKKLEVVASFSIVGDMVARVGGEDVNVSVLIGPNGDAHTFEPTPAHARALAAADIVFANGLGFEPWLDRLATSANAKAKLVHVTKGLSARAFDDGDHGHNHAQDPHAWQDARNALIYVANIAQALAAKDPAILEELNEQDEALEGKRGAKMWAVNVETGEQSTGLDLTSPPVWDGITIAQGRVYVSTVDGRLQCFGK